MKVSFANLAPAREILLSWMGDEFQESGIAFMHYGDDVIVVGYNYSGTPQMLAITIDTYDFQPFKPFLLGRDESELLLERSIYSGIHQMTDRTNLANVREIIFSGIGSELVTEPMAPPAHTELPVATEPPLVWLNALDFEKVCKQFGGFSNGENATPWGLRWETNEDLRDLRIVGGHDSMIGSMRMAPTQISGQGSCQCHIPPQEIADLLIASGSRQLGISPGVIRSGHYEWTRIPESELPPFERVIEKATLHDHLVNRFSFESLRAVFGYAQTGSARILFQVSKSKMGQLISVEANGTIIRQVAGSAFNNETAEVSLIFDRNWLNQAFEILDPYRTIEVMVKTSADPVWLRVEGMADYFVIIAPMVPQP